MKDVVYLAIIIIWVAGIVIAKGFWTTTFAILLAPFSFYLVIEKVMTSQGWL
jgi:hypothetical protein